MSNGAALALVFLTFTTVVLALVWRLSRSRQTLEAWAEREGVELLEARRCFLWRGPFFLRSSDGHAVFRIRVRHPDGREWRGYARVGGWFLGLLSEQVHVEWDR